MALLIAGVVFWGIVHLMPAIAPGVRASLAAKLGEGPFKGLFAVDIVIALALIVFGWKAASPTMLYVPPLYGSPLPSALLALAVLLFVASNTPNNLKRYVRHPQMAAVLLWSIAHLLSNGDSRSVVLFAGLGLWSGLEILFINRRDGKWQKPAAAALANDLVTVVLAILVFTGLVYFHAALFGVAAIPA